MMGFIRNVLSILVVSLSIISLAHAEIVLEDTEGQSTTFSSLKGKWVFINYWAGWCHTCVSEIPEFNRFYQSHKEDPVALYAVNFDGLPLPEQKRLIKQLGMHYPNLIKNPAPDFGIGEIIGLPVTFVFNPKGALIETLYGAQTLKSLNQVIAAAH